MMALKIEGEEKLIIEQGISLGLSERELKESLNQEKVIEKINENLPHLSESFRSQLAEAIIPLIGDKNPDNWINENAEKAKKRIQINCGADENHIGLSLLSRKEELRLKKNHPHGWGINRQQGFNPNFYKNCHEIILMPSIEEGKIKISRISRQLENRKIVKKESQQANYLEYIIYDLYALAGQ